MNTRWRQIRKAKEKWLYPALERKLREEAGNSPGKQCMVTGKLMAMHFNSAKQKNE